ncbi:HNH endonuclease signature motif containing protein [Nocardioides caldifontis]|uniref:HNH endonuclease signature motif containing protein n=1 Tax=Nocardioides caldifontis TaxID=2588938 RepID=UPI0011DF5247|nr:HNH endonuclease signature motif containing protein [Nocardioides caldifontis]
MFDWTGIDELDADATADALARSRVRVLEAQAEQLLLAAQWADLRAPEFVDECLATLPGEERVVPSGADGCPQIDEFAGAELAALLGRTTQSGEQLLADAVNLRHRHPQLWADIRCGRVPVWLAAKVARRCAAVGLTLEQARWVDTQTTQYLPTLPVNRFLKLVNAKIAEADPEAAAARAEAERLKTFVQSGVTDEHGMRTLVARADAGEVMYVVAVIDRIAVVLAEQGDTDPVDVRRAKGLRILANPERALALLLGASLEHADDEPEPQPDDLAGVHDVEGRRPWDYRLRVDDLTEQPLDEAIDGLDEELGGQLRELTAGAVGGDAAADAGRPGGLSEEDRALLRSVLDALGSSDASRFDPVLTLHVHLSEAALHRAAGLTDAGPRIARVEEIGPVVLESLRRWLGDATAHRIVVKPVLDHVTVVPVDRYEIPRPMRELVEVRDPFEVFPYGTLPSRRCDKDHPQPYDRGPRDGRPPPGQTSMENLGPLSRKHHRLKTHGGWRLHHPEPGVYWWRLPHGHWIRVDDSGTHQHGRDPVMDLRLGIAVIPPSLVG